MILNECKHKHKYSEEFLKRYIILYLSEYLDMLIESTDQPGSGVPGFEKKIKALHDILDALNLLGSK